AMLFQNELGPVAAGIDSLFLMAFAAVVWREVLAGRNWRNIPVCLLVTGAAAGNIAFHLQGLDASSGPGERLAIGVAATLSALIGGRITPSFTGNWLRAHGSQVRPAPASRFDLAVLLATAAAALAWTAAPDAKLAGGMLAAAGVANFARLSR